MIAPMYGYMNERKTVDEKQENEKSTRSSKPSRKVSGIISRKPIPHIPDRPHPIQILRTN